MTSDLTRMIEAVASISSNNARWELERLQAVEQWAKQQLKLDYETGDIVAITSEAPSNVGGGWHHYREALAVGQQGVAGEIEFNASKGKWMVMVTMSRTWSVHVTPRVGVGDKILRFWNGPADERPKGYEEAAERPKSFYLDVDWVARATPEQGETAPGGEAVEASEGGSTC